MPQDGSSINFEKDQFAKGIGAQFVEAGEGYARVRAEVKPELANLHGFAHGGLIFSLADAAFALSVNQDRARAAVQFNMNILRAAPIGEVLMAESKEIYRGRSQSVVELKVTDSRGRLVASGQATALPVNYGVTAPELNP
jgi:acyl-CoA thioesterase